MENKNKYDIQIIDLTSILLVFTLLLAEISFGMSTNNISPLCPWHHYCFYKADVNHLEGYSWYPIVNESCIQLDTPISPGNVKINGHGLNEMGIISDWIFSVKFYGKYSQFPSRIKYFRDNECNENELYEQIFYYKSYFNEMIINNQTIIESMRCIDTNRLLEILGGTLSRLK
eukprot:347070_1